MFARRRAILALGASALAVPHALLAQSQKSKIPRIDYLTQGSAKSRAALLDAFKDGLLELGWIDGKNVIIDVHGALPYEFSQLAASLVKRNPTAIVGTCIPSTRAAMNATSTIPVVMAVNGDPVASGLVTSLARPGANVTGMWTLFERLIPKWLEIMTTMVPAARTVGVVANPDGVDDEYWWAQAQQAAEHINVKVVRADAPERDGAAALDRAFATMDKGRAGAFVLMVDAYFLSEVQRIVSLANEYRLPGMYGFSEYAEAGGLVSYGLSYRAYYKAVARYVDEVLRGSRPADLPVQQPSKIELAVNVETARKLGVTIPNEILVRADRVIG